MMATTSDSLDIFSYSNYRLFLDDYIRIHYLAKGKSYRAISKRCGISSPNYFQQVISAQKNMSPQMAEKIAPALNLQKMAAKFLVALVRLDSTADPDKRFALLGELKNMLALQKKKTVKDESFHSSWIHQVIWALAHTEGFQADPIAIQRAIRSPTSLEEIEQSLTFLKKKGYLRFVEEQSRYEPQVLQIETSNDLRNFNLQRNHNRFLQMAQVRLNDALQEREFQGLTVAIPKAYWPVVKEKMREFVSHINEVLDEPPTADAVIRLQMAAFMIADPKRSPDV